MIRFIAPRYAGGAGQGVRFAHAPTCSGPFAQNGKKADWYQKRKYFFAFS